MVGTTRFELATSPTPITCTARILNHLPQFLHRHRQCVAILRNSYASICYRSCYLTLASLNCGENGNQRIQQVPGTTSFSNPFILLQPFFLTQQLSKHGELICLSVSRF